MAEDSKFKFIQIEDDDEIVIQAGAASSGTGVRAHEGADIDGEHLLDEPEEGLAYAMRKNEGFVEDGNASEDVHADETPEEAVERKRFEREKARRQAMAEANRMVTTEEDLKSSVPFAGMQRAIIVAAIVLIIVFVAYYQLGGM